MLNDQALVWDTDRDPVDVLLRRTEALLNDLRPQIEAVALAEANRRLKDLARRARDASAIPAGEPNDAARRDLAQEVSALRRSIAWLNPLLDFDEIVFVSRRNAHKGIIQGNSAYSPVAGGGLYVASGLRSRSPRFRNVLESSRVLNGSRRGQTLHELVGQSFQGLDLSFDGRGIVFAFADVRSPVQLPFHYNGSPCAMHIFRADLDGSGLTQLTDGIWKDHSPCWIPGGRIVFLSERRQLTNRCSTRKDYESAATLFSMKADGSDLYPISWHEADELHPSVTNDGMLVYTRWDYVDRDFNAAHHLWVCGPDGTNPRAPHGNYPRPDHTFEGTWSDGRAKRPWAEQSIRAIPGTNGVYVAVATGHHTPAHGPLICIDLRLPDNQEMSQVRVITGDGGMPTDKQMAGKPSYVTPWPLGENYHLAAESNTKDVFLIDAFGNRELLFTAEVDLPVFDPIPVKARPSPPVVPIRTFQGERAGSPAHKRAVISVMNVYDSAAGWPANTRITALRIIEVFGRTWEWPTSSLPQIGYGKGSNARMVLGTVPVEDDGSAYFEAPVGKAIYFQALDEDGMAVQSMRSLTYVHPGEHLTCAGCHENGWTSPAARHRGTPTAHRRPPSSITPEGDGSRPFSFARLALPVLRAKCMDCHLKKQVKPDFSLSAYSADPSIGFRSPLYAQLEPYAFYFHGEGANLGLSQIHGGYRTVPGRFGARQAALTRYLDPSHHQVQLAPEERRRLTLWLDCNTNELGAYQDAIRQRAGELVWPDGVDPANPAGVEIDRPLP